LAKKKATSRSRKSSSKQQPSASSRSSNQKKTVGRKPARSTKKSAQTPKAAAKQRTTKKPGVQRAKLDQPDGGADDSFEKLNVASQQDSDHREYVSISQETRRRYLNYAMSVIQSRALPDVRDGLKPVQRRILYVMYDGLRLTHDAKTRKCAKISGDTTGNYHPHGDQAVYDALVRLAQDFTYREPLIDGQGNFGSVMGLPAAAPRYTEARLTQLAEHLMNELRFDTVEMRPTYDGATQEPVVLPARYPNLVVNGTQGIAVGMATSIPPHNLGEVIKAFTSRRVSACPALCPTKRPTMGAPVRARSPMASRTLWRTNSSA